MAWPKIMKNGISMPRVYIPEPTGYTRHGTTYGIKVMGYAQTSYELLARVTNSDSRLDAGTRERYQQFYDFVSAHYDIDLTRVPEIHPYVQYVDYMKRVGGGIASYDAKSIKDLAKKHNVLVVTDDDEREYLKLLHRNVRDFFPEVRTSGNRVEFPTGCPARFAAYIAQQGQKVK